jgi:hypothetical protein
MERMIHHVRRAYWSHVRHGAQFRRDIWAMQALAPLASPYLPWTYFAMRPSGVVAILNDIAVNHRTHIVECGGGVSTLYIARLLRERDGHLYTVEESKVWVETLSDQLAREHLTEHVSLIHAPIEEIRLDGAAHRWYSPGALSSLTERGDIDLLIVDGPVAEDDPRIRYPALPVFHRSLKAGATVVVDDIDRLGEQQIVSRWEDELGLRFDRRFLNGIAIASVPAPNARRSSATARAR